MMVNGSARGRVTGFKFLYLVNQMLFNVLTRMGGLAGAPCRNANKVHSQFENMK